MTRASTNDAAVLSSIGHPRSAPRMNAHLEQPHTIVITMKSMILRFDTAVAMSQRQARKRSQTTSTATTILSAEALIKLAMA